MASEGGAVPGTRTRAIALTFDLPGTPLRLTTKGVAENPYASGDARTAPLAVRKKADEESRLPGKALEQKKTRVARPHIIGAVKNSASKKAGSSVAVQKGAEFRTSIASEERMRVAP